MLLSSTTSTLYSLRTTSVSVVAATWPSKPGMGVLAPFSYSIVSPVLRLWVLTASVLALALTEVI